MKHQYDSLEIAKVVKKLCVYTMIFRCQVELHKANSPLLDIKKVNYVVGFDAVAQNMKKKVINLAKRKGISSFTLIADGKKSGEPIYSGGMVGDAATLVNGLYHMAKQREDVRALIEIVAKALKSNDLQEFSSLVELEKEGVLSQGCYNALIGEGFKDLKELKEQTKEQVLRIRNIGQKAFAEIESLMRERNWEFKK